MLFEKHWKPEAVMMFICALFVCLLVTAVAALGLERFRPGLSESDRMFAMFVVNAVGFHGMLVLVAHFFLKAHGVAWREFLGLDLPLMRSRLALGAGVGVALVAVGLGLKTMSAEVLQRLLENVDEQPAMKVLEVSIGVWRQALFAMGAITLAPLAEEILFRGVFYVALRQYGYPRLALWGTALLFGAFHANLVTFLPLVYFGLVMAVLLDRTQALIVTIVAHLVFNLANFALYFVLPTVAR